jgi:predicted RNA-binding Zn-ribbon protein involved in translation (DUF1610 family)
MPMSSEWEPWPDLGTAFTGLFYCPVCGVDMNLTGTVVEGDKDSRWVHVPCSKCGEKIARMWLSRLE